MNDYQKKRFALTMIQKMCMHRKPALYWLNEPLVRFNTISGKRIAMFGFAFKKNTGDVSRA